MKTALKKIPPFSFGEGATDVSETYMKIANYIYGKEEVTL